MKTKQISLIVLTILFTTGMAFCAESLTNENRSAIGIRLDSTPLPELLVKHLGLKPGQGLRIANVMKNSAADEAGLERDDIVIGFQGKDVTDAATLTNEVRLVGVGKEVPLDIIHLGQHETITLTLKAVITGTPDWKYTDEPQIEQFFQPSRIFRFGPDEGWTQIPEDNIPNNLKLNIDSIFNEMYSSTSIINGKTCSVTIEGNPKDKDSKITVKIDNDEYKTKIGELDKLPQEYQEAAKNAIENAKQKETTRIPMFFDDSGGNIMPRLNIDPPRINIPNSLDTNPFFQRMEEQMRQMQEQFRNLEESHQKLLERLNQNQDQVY